jgi:ABC-type branched-subunit amino acid transport system substrate-binding protein
MVDNCPQRVERLAISRRVFLNSASMWGIGAMLRLAGAQPVKTLMAQQQPPSRVRILHLSSRQGPSAEMASYAIMGAQLGAEEAGVTAGLFGTKVDLIIEDAVTSDRLSPLVRQLGAGDKLSAIVAALDDPTTASLSAFARQARVVCLNTTARGGELRGEQCHRLLFHVEPDLAMYTHAMGQWLIQNDRKRWYFIVADGASGREVYHWAGRLSQQQGGAEVGRSVIAPGQSDYKDVFAQLGRGDAEAVVVALGGRQLRDFLEQYKASGLTAVLAGVPLDMIALWQADAESLQGVWVASWYHGLERFSARELNRRFFRRFERPAEGFAWANWAAVKLVMEGVLRSASTDVTALVNYLEGAAPFDGHKGRALTFRRWNHQLRQPLYILRARGAKRENAWDLLELIGEMPPPAARGQSVAEGLDSLGEPESESTCRPEAR